MTGAGRAIGWATSEVLTARGHEVVATARDVSILSKLEVAQTLSLDVRDERSIALALQACGEIDAVVNNAAVPGTGPLEGYPLDHLSEVLDTNALGPLRVVQPLLASWRNRGHGVIVNVSSVQGCVATPLEGAYSASKHALEALSQALYFELGHFGIRVVIVEPGYISPGMKHTSDHAGDPVYDELRSQMSNIISQVAGPSGRSAPEVVGEAIARAIEEPDTPLRVPAGDDAAMVLGLRQELDDVAFEATMRGVLGLTW